MTEGHDLSPVVQGSGFPAQAGNGAPPTYPPATPPPHRGGGHDPWDEEEGIGIRGYLGALYRGKWVLLAAAVVGGVAGFLHSRTTEVIPEFAAQGSVWIQGNGGSGQSGPIVTGGLLEAGSWRDLLVTYQVLDPVVMEHRLYVRPVDGDDLHLFETLEIGEGLIPGRYEFRVAGDGTEVYLLREGELVERTIPGEPIGRGQGFTWRVPGAALAEGRAIAFRLFTPRDAARRLQGELRTEMDARGSFLRVEFQDTNAARSAGVVNSAMERFVALAAELKSGNLDAEADLLQEQLLFAQEELAGAERALESFRIQTITLPSDQPQVVQAGLEMTRGPAFNEYFQLLGARDDLRRDRERIEGILAAIPTSGLEFEAIEFIPTAARSAQFQEARGTLLQARAERRALLDRYTEAHPEVVEVTERIQRIEQVTIPGILTELARQLQAEESQVVQRVSAAESNLSEIPQRTIEEARLRRNVDIASDLYGDLRRRYAGAALARASSLPDVQVLDWAITPSDPVTDEPVSIALLILLGAVGLAAGGVLVFARIDTKVRTPDEVMHAFGLPILGAIPRIRGAGRRGRDRAEIRNLGPVREAFRQLRTNLEYAYGSAGPVTLTISSSSMNEGKTLVTTNLGISFAELGLRTVIVDGDTRRGDIHHFLGADRTPGLTDFLIDQASGEEVIQETAHQGLDFIGSGTRYSNSPELLSSARMGDLLAALRKMYDVILVDSPPLGAGSDSLVLGSITGHMALVIRSGSTDRDFAQAKLEPLYRLPIRLMGVVLNDYIPDRISAYRHYGSYLSGYEAVEEADLPREERRLAVSAGGARSSDR